MTNREGREANYAGTYEGHLKPGDKLALLVVDMVQAYLEPDSPLYCDTAQGALEVTNSLLDACHDAQIPVILTNVEYEPGGADGGVFYQESHDAGNSCAEEEEREICFTQPTLGL